MDLSSFVMSLGTSFMIFVVLFMFTWLSRTPGNRVIYYPLPILKGNDPYEGEGRQPSRNPFAWIHESLSATELDVLETAGVDSAVYLVFFSTVLGILFLSGIVLLPVLLPVAGTDNGMKFDNRTSYGAFNDLERLSMGNVQEGSMRLWAFFIATYWVSVVTYWLLWRAYRHVSDLRATALKSKDVKIKFAILVRDLLTLRNGETRKEQVDFYFKSIYPDAFYKSMIVTDNRKVNKIYEELWLYKNKLARAEFIYANSKAGRNPEGKRPIFKTGLFGLIGEKVDSLDYFNAKIIEKEKELEAEQNVTLKEKQLPSALVFFDNPVTAASASQSLHAPYGDTWTVLDVPEPSQLLWDNLYKGFYERQIRQYVVYFIVFLTIFFYMMPIGFISAFTTLRNLKKLLPFLEPIVEHPEIKTVLEAYLPQLALILFLALLPKFLLILSKAEGITSQSHATRAASGKYFYFSVLNVFIGVTIGGTLVGTLRSIEKYPKSFFLWVASRLPSNATFFLTYVALKLCVGYGLELSRIIPLITYYLKCKCTCLTEDDVKKAWAPGDMEYATRVPNDLLIITIVLSYSVIAPVIIPFGLMYFGLGWLVTRRQVLKVYKPSYESYGRSWPHIHTRMVAVLTLHQLTMIAYFGVKKFIYTPLLVPLPTMSLIFGFICHRRFYRFFKSAALEVVSLELNRKHNLEEIYKSYLPQSLKDEKRYDDQYA